MEKVNKQVAIIVSIITGIVLLYNIYQYLNNYGFHPTREESQEVIKQPAHIVSKDEKDPEGWKIGVSLWIIFHAIYIVAALNAKMHEEYNFYNGKHVKNEMV